jgi:methionyl-tRNA formyltransferase
MRALFFGTPAFAVPSLDHLVGAGHAVVGVVTQPDRPKGRGQHLAAPPVKVRALELGLPVLQPDRLRDLDVLDSLRSLGAEIAVVAAYGKILPQVLLDIPRDGFINVHASLLPRWRGAAPIHRAILAGDHETGITIMRVVLALDAGPMLARVSTPIDPNETSETLESRLADLGGQLLVRTIAAIAAGSATEEAQDERLVTYASKIERRDSAVDWRRPAAGVHNHIRGLHPWPLASTMLGDTRLLLRRSAMATSAPSGAPGTVIAITGDAMTVACGDGAVDVLEVQPEGRRPMPASAFLRGQRLGVGAALNVSP